MEVLGVEDWESWRAENVQNWKLWRSEVMSLRRLWMNFGSKKLGVRNWELEIGSLRLEKLGSWEVGEFRR